jgi:hypothetical protein
MSTTPWVWSSVRMERSNGAIVYACMHVVIDSERQVRLCSALAGPASKCQEGGVRCRI